MSSACSTLIVYPTRACLAAADARTAHDQENNMMKPGLVASALALVGLPAFAAPTPVAPPSSGIGDGLSGTWVDLSFSPHSTGDALAALALPADDPSVNQTVNQPVPYIDLADPGLGLDAIDPSTPSPPCPWPATTTSRCGSAAFSTSPKPAPTPSRPIPTTDSVSIWEAKRSPSSPWIVHRTRRPSASP